MVKAVTGRRDKREAAKQDVLHEVNAHVHEAALRFEGVDPGSDRWDFTCECGAPDCRSTVSLLLADYGALRTAGRPVLAPGHEETT